MAPGVRLRVMWGTPDDPAGFDRHYRDVHIPLARQLPGLRAYTLSRAAGDGDEQNSCYLIAELDFDDVTALNAALGSPEGEAAAADGALLSAGASVQSAIYQLETGV
jgi:uncharacterized protein (TIGR02118 family)